MIENITGRVPGSTVIGQNISLSQQISIRLMIATIRTQLKQLLDNRNGVTGLILIPFTMVLILFQLFFDCFANSMGALCGCEYTY